MHETGKPLLDLLQGKAPKRRPVWLMRQAGRYLPEYRELRAKAGSFLSLCLNPDFASEVTLQPIRRFGMDGAILFADILLVPMALGRKLEFREGEGPVLEKIEDARGIEALSFDHGKIFPVFETLRRVKKSLPAETTLIGFCGSPWTVACYMIDGNSGNDFILAKSWARENPELLSALIAKLVDASEIYLTEQVKAGVEVLQLFDSWAGLLEANDFRRFVIEPTRELVARMKRGFPHIPIIGFPRAAKPEDYKVYVRETGVDCLSFDFDLPLAFAKSELQPGKILQGNLDPALLARGGEEMKKALVKIMETFGARHIVNLGHGVVPETPPEHVGELVDFVHNFPV